MATRRQIEANRNNSAMGSSGPKTDLGKSRSRQNAITHGLAGESVDVEVGVLPELARNPGVHLGRRTSRWARPPSRLDQASRREPRLLISKPARDGRLKCRPDPRSPASSSGPGLAPSSAAENLDRLDCGSTRPSARDRSDESGWGLLRRRPGATRRRPGDFGKDDGVRGVEQPTLQGPEARGLLVGPDLHRRPRGDRSRSLEALAFHEIARGRFETSR